MDWNEFYKAVKSGRYQSVYLFSGPEELTKREALAALRRALLPPGLEQLNEAVLENCSAQAIIDSAETLPVMCDRRIVVVRDWGPLTSGKVKNEEDDVKRMLEWLKTAPESCIIVFYMTVELDGRKKLTGALKKLEGYVEFTHLSGAVLLKWCNQQLKPMGKAIRSDALNELTLMAGQDLTRISGELKKLAAYIGDAPEIAPEDVRAIVAPNPDYMVFMILDHLLEGRLAEATRVLNAELQGRSNSVGLIVMFAKQLRIDAHIKYAMETGGDMAGVLKNLGITPYRAKHITRQIQNISAASLEARYLSCVEANYAITSGRINERAALDDLMLKIALPDFATKTAQPSSNR